MTITAFAGELAGQIRTQPVFDTPQVRLGLQLAVAVWLDGAWDGSAAMRWGLFGTAVQEVLVAMFPSPPEQLVQLDPQGLSDDRLAGAAVADLVTAIADLLDTTTTTDGGGATALHRRWAQQLRDAVADLQ